jgi:hypothetical protein
MEQAGKTCSKKLSLPLILFLALTVASCASTGGSHDKKLEELLKASVETFNSAFKWEEYSDAAVFVPSAKKEAFWAEVDKFKGKIRLTEYELREVEVKQMSGTATAILRFQYWRLEEPTLVNVTLTQKWHYIEKDKLWKVSESGFGAITKTPARF